MPLYYESPLGLALWALTLLCAFNFALARQIGTNQTDEIVDCGCPTTCTSEALNRTAVGFGCGDRMQYLADYENMTEIEACRRIAGVEYPTICGPDCHPDWCVPEWPTQAPTEIPTLVPTTATPSSAPTAALDCGCPATCTEAVLNQLAGPFTCGDRITYLLKYLNFTETEACQTIAEVEWPDVCGPCVGCYPTQAPTTMPSLAPTPEPDPPCGCPTCTATILSNMAGPYTCKQRIDFLVTEAGGGLNEIDACRRVAVNEFQAECNGFNGVECNPDLCMRQEPVCGCNECDAGALETMAGPFSCRNRIFYLQTGVGGNLTELEACHRIASVEFPSTCGPACDPTRCDGRTVSPSQAPSSTPSGTPSQSPTKVPTASPSVAPTKSPAPTTSPTVSVAPSSSPTSKPSSAPSAEPRFCGCSNCTLSFMENTMAGDFSCKSRIDWLQTPRGGGLNATWSCIQIANSEYPQTCGLQCNPLTCHDTKSQETSADERQEPPEPAPTFCGCQDCTPDFLLRDAAGVSCASRISWLQTPIGTSHTEVEACSIIAGSDYPDMCSRACDPDRCDGRAPPMCGCKTCTEEILNRYAGGNTCGERIRYLQSLAGGNLTEAESCMQIAASDYPGICGPECDPNQCHGLTTRGLRGGEVTK